MVLKKLMGWIVGTFVVLYVIGTMVPTSQVTGLHIPPSSAISVQTPQEPEVTLASVLNAHRGAGPVTLPQPSDYRSFCIEQWTKRGIVDGSMVDYCIKSERDGYDKIVRTAAKYTGLFWLQSVLDSAEQEWTKRGIRQDSMVAYEMNHQIDAFLDLQYELAQGRLNNGAGTACLAEWTKNATPNWPMVQYCYKRQTGKD
jgi:hypothetical protein